MILYFRMKNFLSALILIILTFSPTFAEEAIVLDVDEDYATSSKDVLVPDPAVLETPLFESEVEKSDVQEIPDISKPQSIETENTKIIDRIKYIADDVYKLQIENTRVPASLFKEYTTQHFEKGPLDNIHYWAGFKIDNTTNISGSDGNATNVLKMSLINVFIDGTFKGGKENFRIMLDPSPNPAEPFMQHLFQDLYIDTKRIPHHRILVGNSRPGVGYEGAGSAYTLPFAARSQISRNFGTIRKLGVRVMGNYSLLDYDLGGYSSGTNFSSFFPGIEFDGWVNFKPLGKTNGKYGKLTLGGGITAGQRDSESFNVVGAYIGYRYKRFWTKAEFANADGSNGGSGFTTKHRQGWYVTAGYKLTKKLELVARYDEFDPDKNIKNNNRREYSAGVNYYIKGQALRVLLNYVFCQNQSTADSHRIVVGLQIML